MTLPHKSTSFGRSGSKLETESPFVRAGQMWDRRLGTLRTGFRILVGVAAIQGVVILGMGFALLSAVNEKQVEVHFVEINEAGRPVRLAQTSRGWTPTEVMIQRSISDLVGLMRSKPSDPVVQRKQWATAYRFLAGDAIGTMNELGAMRASQDLVAQVEVASVVRQSDQSIQVNWTEEVIDAGRVVDRQPWTGIFRYTQNTPETREEAFKNPLGIFVTSISWDKDVRLTAR